MLKRAKQWYVDTPQLKRYGWGFTISGAIGVAAFCTQLAKGADYFHAIYSGFPFVFSISILILVLPFHLVDGIRGYWKHGFKLDEMEKDIFQRARGIAFMVNYSYLCVVLLGIGFYSYTRDIDQIPLELLLTILMGAVFLLIWILSIATVVLYSKLGNTSDLPETPEHAKTEP
jgi:hypothetical protein